MNIRFRSLRARIVWLTALVSSIAMIVAVSTMVLVVVSLTNGRVKASADYRFDTRVATMSQKKSGHISLLETPSDVIEDRVWVFNIDGKQVAGPTAGSNITNVVRSLSAVTTRTEAHRGNYRYVAGPVKNERTGETFAVVVAAASSEAYENQHTGIFIGLSVLGLMVIGGTSALSAWIVGRTLGPVKMMAENAEEWSEYDLDTRFEPGPSDDEITDLGRTLNILLDRVATTIRGEQLLTSELAHELRTPLTAIRGEAELGLMGNLDPAAQDRLERIVVLSDRMTSTISTLVALARGRSQSGQRSTVAAAVSNVIGGTNVPAGISVDVDNVSSSIEVAATIEMVERTLAPLIDNGLRFAVSKLTISTASVGRVVQVRISDDGPGMDADAEVFGAGLGLALAQRVARALGGDVRLTSPAKPTTFTVDFPSY